MTAITLKYQQSIQRHNSANKHESSNQSFQSVERFWEDLFPLERDRRLRLLIEKVEIRETGIDMELKIQGLSGLIMVLSGLASEAGEPSNNPRRPSRISV